MTTPAHTRQSAVHIPAPAAYLEYLDKEMTITGVLSAFSAAVCAFALDRIAGAEPGTLFAGVWHAASPWVVTGLCCALGSALAFYMQRSHLAWLYGQIALRVAAPALFPEPPLDEWLEEADSWATWLRYRWGFGLLFAAAAVFAEAFVVSLQQDLAGKSIAWAGWPVLIALSALAVITYVLRRYPYAEEPFVEFWRSVYGERSRAARR